MNTILMRFCIILILPFLSTAQCDHTIVLSETFGDGWNNGASLLEVTVNGVTVLSGITLGPGSTSETYTFQADDGDVIEVYLTVSNDPWFTLDNSSVEVFNNAMTSIGSGTPDLAPNTLTFTGGTCPTQSSSGCAHSIQLSENFGDGWNNGESVLEVTVNGIPVLSNLTLFNGATEATFFFNAELNDNIDVYLTQDNDPWFISDGSSIEVFNQQGTSLGSGTPTTTPGTLSFTAGDCPVNSCMHSISLFEDFGDGWGGGTALLELTVNGTPVLTDLTLVNSTSQTFEFPANTGDNIAVYLTQNNDFFWDDDNSGIELYDSQSNSLGTGVPPMAPSALNFTAGMCPTPTPLPVELSNFHANCESIMWSTASEFNASHFIIEESLDGINWKIVAEHVKAVGNSTVQQDYTINHSSKHNLTYYQIKQYDINGKYEKLGMISVNCNKSNANITPVNYFNLMGQQIQLDEFSQGVYIILYSDGTTEKVFK